MGALMLRLSHAQQPSHQAWQPSSPAQQDPLWAAKGCSNLRGRGDEQKPVFQNSLFHSFGTAPPLGKASSMSEA